MDLVRRVSQRRKGDGLSKVFSNGIVSAISGGSDGDGEGSYQIIL